MKVAMLVSAAVMVLVLVAGTARAAAESIEYYVIIEGNGNAIVVITINGTGVFDIPIQDDVEEIEVRGALFLIEDGVLEISVGGSGEAVVIYETSALTGKSGSEWDFSMEMAGAKNSVTVAMPENTVITATAPQAMIESGEIMKLYWSNAERVSARYYFLKGGRVDLAPYTLMLVAGLAAASAVAYAAMRVRVRAPGKMKKSMDKKESVIETLSENERKVVMTLIGNDGRMKRSRLERETGISKSSLAVALKNLERKKIVEVDKRYASHFVRFTEWFNEL